MFSIHKHTHTYVCTYNIITICTYVRIYVDAYVLTYVLCVYMHAPIRT